MSIQNFDSESFVAFTDISGFKEMMRSEKAVQAINDFYNAGFSALQNEPTVNGLFVSDCGILFTRDASKADQLTSLLKVVAELNRTMLDRGVMLTTSISYGPFSYHNRIEFPGINKQPIYGNAYLSAFLDNANGKPKIQPGRCRILKRNLSEIPHIEQSELLEVTKNHYLYYWNVDSLSEIEHFKQRYHNSYNLKFAGMLSALRNANG